MRIEVVILGLCLAVLGGEAKADNARCFFSQQPAQEVFENPMTNPVIEKVMFCGKRDGDMVVELSVRGENGATFKEMRRVVGQPRVYTNHVNEEVRVYTLSKGSGSVVDDVSEIHEIPETGLLDIERDTPHRPEFLLSR